MHFCSPTLNPVGAMISAYMGVVGGRREEEAECPEWVERLEDMSEPVAETPRTGWDTNNFRLPDSCCIIRDNFALYSPANLLIQGLSHFKGGGGSYF